METYKQMMDSMGQELILLCKQKKLSGEDFERVTDLLLCGCDVNFNGSRPMFLAVKNYNFELVKLLIRYGALDVKDDQVKKTKTLYADELLNDESKLDDSREDSLNGGEVVTVINAMRPGEVSRKFLASMCERGAFTKKKEEGFWGLIDTAIKRTGFDEIYLAPYINVTLLAGSVDKLIAAVERYGLSMKRAMSHVKIMVIFEVIEHGLDESLRLIDEYLDWHSRGLDLAVAKGKIRAAEYILFKDRDVIPSKDSIVKAIVSGCLDMLELLNLYGIDLFDEAYVKAAVLSFPASSKSLKFLSDRGVTIAGYDGKSLYENALELKNKKLLEFVRTLNIIQR